MAVEYVRRGEIYAIRDPSSVGSEQGYSRPGLVISNNAGNSTSPIAIVAMLTTKDNNIGIHWETKATGRLSYVQCEQIYTVSKERFGRLLGELSPNEMREVENRLDEVLDLGYVDDTPLKEKEKECEALRIQLEELKAENAELKKKDAAHADELLTRDVEIAIKQRMYDKAVGIIAAIRSEPDLPDRPVYVPKEPPKPKKPVEVPEPPEPKLIDINSCSFGELRSLGNSTNIAATIINNRPYKKIEDLKKVPGVNAIRYNLMEKKICCIPVKPEPPEPKPVVETPPRKVNVNTASAQEIHEVTGMAVTNASGITRYRKEHGPYKTLDDLLNAYRYTPGMLKKHRDKMEV